jgi:hypothetical protein
MSVNSTVCPPTSEESTRQSVNTRWFCKFEIMALAVIILIGLVHLPQPFHDDQAFFAVGAQKLSHGALLYRDYWDIKQPGIFWFYEIGGKLFGFSEVGIQGLELLFMLGLAATLMITLRSYFEHRWLNGLVALLTVGFYYGICGLPHLTQDYMTQVEGLVGFPMFLCIWFASRAVEGKSAWGTQLLLSGFMGGLVLLLKLIFLPMLLCSWMAAFWYAQFQRRENLFATAARFGAPIVLGLAGPILFACGYFAWRGGLSELFFTSFVWPIHAIGKLPLAGPGRLHEGLAFFVDGFAPLLGLGFVGTWWSLRRRKDLLTINLLLWIVTGAMVILIQRRSWWPYHYLLLFVPLGILGTKGVEWLWQQLQFSESSGDAVRRRGVLGVGLMLLFSPVLYPLVSDAFLLARYKFALNKQQRLNFQCRYPNSQYPAALTEVEFLSKRDSLPGPIYVGGSPLYYFLSGREPAIALTYGLDDLVPEQWPIFAKQLSEARPGYVFLLPTFHDWIQTNSPHTIEFIEANYRLLGRSEAGAWYVLKSP